MLAARIGPAALWAVSGAALISATMAPLLRWTGGSTWWLALVPGIAALAALWRGWSNRPDEVEAAIALDRTHGLNDAVATAITASRSRHADSTFVELQRAAVSARMRDINLQRLAGVPQWPLVSASGASVVLLAVALIMPWPTPRSDAMAEKDGVTVAEGASETVGVATTPAEVSAELPSLAERIEELAQAGNIDGAERALDAFEERLRELSTRQRESQSESPALAGQDETADAERARTMLLDSASRLGEAAEAMRTEPELDSPPAAQRSIDAAPPPKQQSRPIEEQQTEGARQESPRAIPRAAADQSPPRNADNSNALKPERKTPPESGKKAPPPETRAPGSTPEDQQPSSTGKQDAKSAEDSKTKPAERDSKLGTSEPSAPPERENTPNREGAKPREGVKPREGGEQREGAKPREGGEQSEGAKPRETGEQREGAKPREGGEQSEGAKPREGGEQREGAKPREGGEQREGTKPREGGERGERGDGAERREGAQPRETGEQEMESVPDGTGQGDASARREQLRQRLEELSRRLGDDAMRGSPADDPMQSGRRGGGAGTQASDAEPGSGQDAAAGTRSYDVEATMPDPDHPGRIIEAESPRDDSAPLTRDRSAIRAGSRTAPGSRGAASDPSVAPRFRPLLERYYERLRSQPAPAERAPAEGRSGEPSS